MNSETTRAVIAGLMAATWVLLGQKIHSFQGFFGLAVTIAIISGFAFFIERPRSVSRYRGLSDLFLHVQTPGNAEPSMRWFIRAVISFAFQIFGSFSGPVGAASEGSLAFLISARNRSAEWSEQRRRTDVAIALSAGFAAAFGSPFAAVLLPIELGMGGRILSTIVASIIGFLGVRIAGDLLHLNTASVKGISLHIPVEARFGQLNFWIVWIGFAVLSALVGVISLRVWSLIQKGTFQLSAKAPYIRPLLGGAVLLSLLAFARPPLGDPFFELSNYLQFATASECFLTTTRILFSTLILIACFGSLGIFWPLFLAGSLCSLGLHQLLFDSYPSWAYGQHASSASLAGALSFFGVWLGVPWAGAMLGFEMTGQITAILPCLLAGWIGREIGHILKTPSFWELDLESRGLKFVDGRSKAVLESLSVKDAMVSDIQTVVDNETMDEILSHMLNSKYPFLPVIDRSGKYMGLITVDMVHENAQVEASKWLEAKDVLYRAGAVQTQTIRITDSLAVTEKLFRDSPCIPVTDADRKVLGLLFSDNVRLVYDREVARRSLVQHQKGSAKQ